MVFSMSWERQDKLSVLKKGNLNKVNKADGKEMWV